MAINISQVTKYISEKYGGIREARKALGIQSASQIRAYVTRQIAQERQYSGKALEQAERLAQSQERKAEQKAREAQAQAVQTAKEIEQKKESEQLQQYSKTQLVEAVQKREISSEAAQREIIRREPQAQQVEERIKKEGVLYITYPKKTEYELLGKSTVGSQYVVAPPVGQFETQREVKYSSIPRKDERKVPVLETTIKKPVVPKVVDFGKVEAPQEKEKEISPYLQKRISAQQKGEALLDYSPMYELLGLSPSPDAKGFVAQTGETAKALARGVYEIPKGVVTSATRAELLGEVAILGKSERKELIEQIKKSPKEIPSDVAKGLSPYIYNRQTGRWEYNPTGTAGLILTGVFAQQTYKRLSEPKGIYYAKKGEVGITQGRSKGTVKGGEARPVGFKKGEPYVKYIDKTRSGQQIKTTIGVTESGKYVKIQEYPKGKTVITTYDPYLIKSKNSVISQTGKVLKTFEQGAKNAVVETYKNGVLKSSKSINVKPTDSALITFEKKPVISTRQTTSIEGVQPKLIQKAGKIETYTIKGQMGKRVLTGEIVQRSRARAGTIVKEPQTTITSIQYKGVSVPKSISLETVKLELAKRGQYTREPSILTYSEYKPKTGAYDVTVVKSPPKYTTFEYQTKAKGTFTTEPAPTSNLFYGRKGAYVQQTQPTTIQAKPIEVLTGDVKTIPLYDITTTQKTFLAPFLGFKGSEEAEVKISQPEPSIEPLPPQITTKLIEQPDSEIKTQPIVEIKPTQLNEPVVSVAPLIKPRVKSTPVSKVQPVTETTPVSEVTPIEEVAPVVQPVQRVRPIQQQAFQRQPRQYPFRTFETFKQTQIRPILPFLSLPKQKTELGFNVFVRRKGQFQKITAQPVSRKEALFYGVQRVSKTAAATFFIQATQQTVESKDVPRASLKDFYTKGNLFIEKPEKRISTFGELREITFKGIAAKKGKALIKNIFGVKV